MDHISENKGLNYIKFSPVSSFFMILDHKSDNKEDLTEFSQVSLQKWPVSSVI